MDITVTDIIERILINLIHLIRYSFVRIWMGLLTYITPGMLHRVKIALLPEFSGAVELTITSPIIEGSAFREQRSSINS